MKSLKATVGATVASAALTLGGMAVAAPQAHAATTLGGLNLAAFCRYVTSGGNVTSWVWIQNPQNVYQWRCSYLDSKGLQTKGMDLNFACRWSYGPGSYAGYLNFNNPYSWRCYR
jgi:hypothetical protein